MLKIHENIIQRINDQSRQQLKGYFFHDNVII